MEDLLSEIRHCRICEDQLPLGPRPVVQASKTARLLIIGQAPGTKVHETGIPWNDASGNRLRDWTGLDRQVFYDPARIAIMPMGFCYPGRFEKGGDLPPRKECAPAWHQRLLDELPDIRLTLLVGSYSQAQYIGSKDSMTERVKKFRRWLFANDADQRLFPLPHPSWRNTSWMKKNPWFEAEVLPVLREEIHQCLE